MIKTWVIIKERDSWRRFLRFSLQAELIEKDGQLAAEGKPASGIRKLIIRPFEVLDS